jgi:hypothetical protein
LSATTDNINYMTAKGWLKEGERKLLFELASQQKGHAVILNIGVEFGASLACLRAGNPTANIIGVDLDITKAVSTYDCELIQADSHKLIKTWRQPLDLIFVDGDHGELGVSLDARFADFLPVGGMVLFQDCFDYDNPTIVHLVCPGVNAAVDKWAAVKQLEFEELPSVETTRIFRRVKEHDEPTITHGGGVDTDLPETRSIAQGNTPDTGKPKVSRSGRSSSRGR